MAIINDPRMYSGGAVTFDTQPTVDLYARLQQRREAEQKAKDEALNQYFSELPKRVNTAGILDVHLRDAPDGKFPGLNTRINQLMEYGKKNMRDIAKGGTAKMDYDQMIQGVVMDIERAKQASKDTLEAAKMKIEGKIGLEDDDLEVLDRMGRSIYDPNAYKPDGVSRYGFMDFSANLPQYDPNKGFESWVKGMKGEKVFDESKKISDPQAGVVRVPFTEKFSQEQVKTAAQSAANEYKSNRSAKRYWDNQYKTVDEGELKDLERYYKKYFGGQIKTPDGRTLDLSEIDSAEEYAMAAAAKRAEDFVIQKDYDTRLDKELASQRAAVNIRLNQGGGGAVPTIDGNEFDRIKPSKKAFGSGYRPLSPQQIPERTKAVLKSAGINLEGAVYFDVEVDENGDLQSITPYFQYDDKGKDIRKSGTITRQDMFDAQLKYNAEPQKGQQPTFGNQPVRLPKDIKNTRMNKWDKYKSN